MINATSLILGHSDTSIADAIRKQLVNGVAYSGPSETQTMLAKKIVERTPSIESLRFTNSGTEATMLAIRTARQYTKKHKIAIVDGGYHGAHEYVSAYSERPKSISEDVLKFNFNDVASVTELLLSNSENIACLIIEPAVARLGYVPADRDFLQCIRDLTDKLGIVLIYDEVQTFRLSYGGAQELFGIIPDMTALGKIIGGGTPIGAFGGKNYLMNLFDPSQTDNPLLHAGTFNGNPIGMVAGSAVLDTLTPDIYDRMNNLGESLRAQLRSVFDEFDINTSITGVGSFFGIHFSDKPVTDYNSYINSDKELQDSFFMGMLNEGVLLQAGTAGSLNILTTDQEISIFIDATRKVAQRIA
jgi:glutamate-1-semialdehyde 2,1-aminomutase